MSYSPESARLLVAAARRGKRPVPLPHDEAGRQLARALGYECASVIVRRRINVLLMTDEEEATWRARRVPRP